MFDIFLRLRNLVEVADILIVALIIYWIMLMFKGTKAERMLWGLGVIVIVYFITQRLELLTLHWILSNFLGSLVIFILVVFQQDIRRALVQMGKPFFTTADAKVANESIEEIVKAVSIMKQRRVGSIIVMERAMDLSDLLEGGVNIDSLVSKELLLSVFNSASPLHDGGVLIRRGRLTKAGCILPLSGAATGGEMKLTGTRHRAALGLAEETDAAIIVVSEETGEAALVVEDEIRGNISTEELYGELKRHFSGLRPVKRSIFSYLWRGGA